MRKQIIFRNFAILVSIFFSVMTISCSKDDGNNGQGPTTDPDPTPDPTGYEVAEAQLLEDYSMYAISDITWETVRGYQVADFAYTTKSDEKTITAWYSVDDDVATREMDSEDLGTTVPSVIATAFNETKYSDSNVWKIEEIELDNSFSNGTTVSVYEMELENTSNPDLEAELFFDADGVLLYAKETTDYDDDDNEESDKFVITDELKAAVEAAVPGATIIDAELDDDIIEVDAYLNNQEIDLEFNLDYTLVSEEIESEYTYSQLPSEFSYVSQWFVNNPNIPAPSADTEVEITYQQLETDGAIGTYYYEVEIDEYEVDDEEYEIVFTLDVDYSLIGVVVNEVLQNSVAETQLLKDYSNYSIKNLNWSTIRDYQVARFDYALKSSETQIAPNITVWYSVNGSVATREMDSEYLGFVFPSEIGTAFSKTEYGNSRIWKVEEIELNNSFVSGTEESVYEIELENIVDSNLEAKLFFNANGVLLYAKETTDNDIDDDNDDINKFVVTIELLDAVEAVVPGATIIDAELDGDIIEVDAYAGENEIDLEFDLDYTLVSIELEVEYTYAQLENTYYDIIIDAVQQSNEITVKPAADTKVEITQEASYEGEGYYYKAEFDEYEIYGAEYELVLFLNEYREVIGGTFNDQPLDFPQ